MKRPSSLGVLVLVLAMFGGLMLLDSVWGGDDDESTSPALPVATVAAADETPVVDAAATTTTTLAVAVPTTEGPVQLPTPAPVAMPETSQFRSVGLRVETALSVSDLTGMVWNNRIGAYYAISQDGFVYRIDRELTSADLVLDLTSEVTELLPGSERGMLGIAFDPRDGRMFLYFTDRGDDTHVISMAMADGRPDPATRREILFAEQPGLGHKAGDLVFDANGILYVALGDGGGSRGADAQDPTKFLGKILRIQPRLDGEGYDVPADNPFVGRSDILPEIWASGLRNPWQMWRNPVNGEWYIGDVGESDIEELNYLPAGVAGANFGWPYLEGTNPRENVLGNLPAGLDVTMPIVEYPHTEGVAIIAGAIYTGSAIPELRGAFVYADMTGPMYGLGSDGSARLSVNGYGVVSTFVETPEGELLMTSLQDGVLRLLPG